MRVALRADRIEEYEAAHRTDVSGEGAGTGLSVVWELP